MKKIQMIGSEVVIVIVFVVAVAVAVAIVVDNCPSFLLKRSVAVAVNVDETGDITCARVEAFD
ncbi:hypothetical protein WUBG_15599 [Wuchereria bancrofti]|uniref:Uncharacterized protein n=1 Tax=Wuchereria bancrofti TaxID=6293 RepID=J9AH78_WUCBA|nr:hypothetical protein WUBG_15599 [Wuchereria bancrofti]